MKPNVAINVKKLIFTLIVYISSGFAIQIKIKLKQMRRLLFVFLIVLSSCTNEEITNGRSFYMGFTMDASSTGTSDVTVSEGFNEAEIIHFRFKTINHSPSDTVDLISKSILEHWFELKSKASATQKIYLSVSPLELFQGGSAKHSTEFENQELRNEIITSIGFFRDPQVTQAYLSYCKKLIDIFEPAYFNMGEDVNQLFLDNPKAWSDFLSFHEYIYTQLKSSYPNLCIFSSVKAEPMVSATNNDFVLQQLVVLQIIDHSDLYALSIRPDCVKAIANSNIKNGFNRLFSISKKPLALSLTNTSQFERTDLAIEPNSGLNSLLSSCASNKTVFIVRDFPSGLPEPEGIKVENLTATTIAWKKYFLLDYKNQVH